MDGDNSVELRLSKHNLAFAAELSKRFVEFQGNVRLSFQDQ